MSRTSLGQRNERLVREEISSLQQVGSTARPNLQEKYLQPTLSLYQEIETFLFMKDKYFRVEREMQQVVIEIGEPYLSVKDDFGVCVFRNGDRYIGEWKNKKMNGLGIYFFQNPQNVVYLGDFQDGRFSGIGKLARFQDNFGQMIYYGSWLDGRKNNLGTHYYRPHSYYFGYWANDCKQGEGKLIFQGGEFVGTWDKDSRQGFGRLRKIDGDITQVFEGKWEADSLPFGKVIYYDQNSTEVGRYEGELTQGCKHGKGKYNWRGAVYEGQFINDCIQGQGTFKIGKTTLKGVFSADFNSNLGPEMKAVIVYEGGDQFDGVVAVREGKVLRLQGLYRFINGDSAEGMFRENPNGQLTGTFIYIWADGRSKQFA